MGPPGSPHGSHWSEPGAQRWNLSLAALGFLAPWPQIYVTFLSVLYTPVNVKF